jgi:hypothetical protein
MLKPRLWVSIIVILLASCYKMVKLSLETEIPNLKGKAFLITKKD